VPTERRSKILFIVGDAALFESHQLRLAQEAIARGFEPVVACGAASDQGALGGMGIRTRSFELSLSGWRPLRDMNTFLALLRLYREEAPHIVHHVSIEQVIYGTLAARFARVPAVVNAFSGLGSVFAQPRLLARVSRGLVNLLYRIVLSHDNMRFIFQSREDLQSFVARNVVPKQSTHLIRGSGIDFSKIPFTSEPAGAVTFVLIAPMLSEKGIREFVAAARNVRRLQPWWRFRLVGGVDPRDPSALAEAELESWNAEGIVERLGFRADVAQILTESHIVCVPSYHENLSNELLEAAAIGRPIIAANLPGCREVVRDGITGLLVEPRDSNALAEAMLRLGQDPDLRSRMGHAARERAAALYSIEDVVHDTFLIYEELLRA